MRILYQIDIYEERGILKSVDELILANTNKNDEFIENTVKGVIENKDGSWSTSGLNDENCQKLIKQFWNDVNNRQKVSINLLKDDDITVYKEKDDRIVVIYVPMARREEKPVYINNNLFNGTYRRNHDGDYHCTRLQVKTMLRDQAEKTMDMEVLDDVPLKDLNYETIQGYRNRHQVLKAGHLFERLNNAKKNVEQKQLSLTN